MKGAKPTIYQEVKMKKKSKVISTVDDNDVVFLPTARKGIEIKVVNNGENDLKIIGVETTVLKKGRSKTFKL